MTFSLYYAMIISKDSPPKTHHHHIHLHHFSSILEQWSHHHGATETSTSFRSFMTLVNFAVVVEGQAQHRSPLVSCTFLNFNSN